MRQIKLTYGQIRTLGFSGLMALGFTAAQAQAAIDVSAATTGISDASTALVTLITAFITLSVTVLGISLVWKFLKRPAGA